jgi:8-amino-7-oxononanoate synthase
VPAPDFSAQLAALAAADRLRRRRTVSSPQSPHVCCDQADRLSFCSNDYLGLASHPRLIAAAAEAMSHHGLGSGASHLVSGHHALHQALEQRLARFMARPCLLFSAGYMANIGVLPALVGREDAIFADRLDHASLIDGARLSRAELKRFRHNDMRHLAQLLANSSARTKLIVVDGVFSMDGDIAPLPEILALAQRHDAWIYVDDAHGFGVLGEGGRGVPEHFGLASERIIHLCTLGKAAGVSGAAVFAGQTVVDWLLQSARSYIFATAAPPALAAALLAAVDLIEGEPQRRRHLQQLIAALRHGCKGLKWPLLPSATPIQPLVVGSNSAALALAEALWERGIWVPAIRPPTVPDGTARLRISLSAAHSIEDVTRLAQTLAALQG